MDTARDMRVSHERRRPKAPRAGVRDHAEASATPYGYTISIWSSGALLMHYRGQPAVGDVFAFVAGAVAGFATLGAVGSRVIRRAKPLSPGPSRVWAGSMHLLAVGAAVGTASLIAQLPGWTA
jgi:hypothetical protein